MGRPRHCPSSIDRMVGVNLRAIREYKGYSQIALAQVLGVTFQQLQKYEKGENRLSAERLYEVCRLFQLPYDCFFHGLDGEACPEMNTIHGDRLALEAFRLIEAVSNPVEKQKIVNVVRALAV
jgi:transcriptional regulator with XRE-family HTH domain